MHILPTPAKTDVIINTSCARSPLRPEIVCVQIGQDCLGREPLAKSWFCVDCKSAEDCLLFLSVDRVRKQCSRGVVFLGNPLCHLCLTFCVTWHFPFSLEMVLGLTTNNDTTQFCGIPAWICCQLVYTCSGKPIDHYSSLCNNTMTHLAMPFLVFSPSEHDIIRH